MEVNQTKKARKKAWSEANRRNQSGRSAPPQQPCNHKCKVEENTLIVEKKSFIAFICKEESEKGYMASQYIKNKFYSYLDIYTDGSKDEENMVGIGIYIPTLNVSIGKRLPDQLSVYTAEMMAIIRLQIDVRFCWVPVHVNVRGNDKADKIAKKSTRMSDTINIPFGKGEAKTIIKKGMMKKWQERWDTDKSGRKYYSIQKSINAQGVNGRNRREESVLTRLRFDHTGLNKTLCLLEDVEHILLHCGKYREERIRLKQKINQTGRKWNLEGILGTTGERVKDAQDAVVEYLKDAGVYYRI
ncbi:hypothetical protein H4Q32_024564 [Labeo rohita]|uniref:RNase H type-1 domain-containing protein n=1 Tax=Labeo rohita TaxID=84645 RepID=A0ABQ8L112_LABRO|nr:hypothetical protein H4Q32_024564 [Labeo rohita]